LCFSNHSGKQLRKYKSTCIEWISETLQTQQIQNLKKAKGQEDKTLLPLLECLVALLTSASAVSRDLTQPAQIAKFIKGSPLPTTHPPKKHVLHFSIYFLVLVDFATKTSDVMEQVNALLSVAAFVQVITHLIHHKDALVIETTLFFFFFFFFSSFFVCKFSQRSFPPEDSPPRPCTFERASEDSSYCYPGG